MPALPVITPLPPVLRGLPRVGSGPALLADPTSFFRRGRARHGDTFVADAFGHRMLCLFSAEGVRSLDALPEHRASFGLATYSLIRFKMPESLLIGRRVTPHALFGPQLVEGYLGALEGAMAAELELLGREGTFEVFSEMRRLAHRLGLASWAGPETAAHLDRLMPLLDQIDSAEAFVRPVQAFRTLATKQRAELAAMAGIEEVVGALLHAREDRHVGDFLDQIAEAWDDTAGQERVLGIARDLMLIHVGALSNLYAALSWTLVDLLLRPDLLARVRAGDDVLLAQCANESIRVAQRSITLRQVIRPVEVDDGERTYSVAPGTFITTMLSVTNTTAAPGLERYDPTHYRDRRLQVELPARELVSTFGHRSHTCPASRFSITAITTAVRHLLDAYDLEPLFREAKPRRQQIGGVARAARPCRVRYTAR